MNWNRLLAFYAPLALRVLTASRLRFGLTLLGIVLGVASVFTMASVTGGARMESENALRVLGTDRVYVSLARSEEGNSELLAETVVRNVALLPEVELVSLIREFGNVEVATEDFSAVGRLVFLQSTNSSTFEKSLCDGRIWVSKALARRLHMVVGAHVRAGNVWSEFAGSEPPDFAEASLGSLIQADEWIAASRSCIHRWLSFEDAAEGVSIGVFRSSEGTESVAAKREVELFLASTSVKSDALRITTSEDLARAKSRSLGSFNALMTVTSITSLLVGGIGLMNILLASVAERIGEIGLLRALGATRTDAFCLVIIESAAASLVGAIVGFVVGVSAAFVVQTLFGWQVVILWWMFPLSVLVSLLVALLFGGYPAFVASNVSPMTALKST